MLKLRLIAVTISSLVGAFTLNACSVKPQAEKSCNFVQNSESQRVSWGSQVPVVLYIDSSVPNEFFDDISRAAATWNKDIGREVIKIGGYLDTKADPAQDGKNVIYYLRNWEPDRSNEQARTTVYWGGDRIYEADVRINAHNFTFSSGDEFDIGRVDMQSLLLHEFGHVLGLAHTSVAGSVMARSLPNISSSSATNDAGVRRQLSGTDEDSIRCEY